MKPPVSVRVNPGHTISQGLAACWMFNEGGGLSLFDSSYQAIGKQADWIVSISSAATTILWSVGRFGPSLSSLTTASTTAKGSFNSGGALTLPFAAGITYEAYLRYDGGDTYGTLLGVSGAEGIFIHSGKLDWLSVSDADGTATLTTGVWYHIVAVATATAVSYYINGVLDATVSHTYSGNFAPNEMLNGAGSDTFIGICEYMRLWSRALTPTEVLTLYQDPYCIMEPPKDAISSIKASGAGPMFNPVWARPSVVIGGGIYVS